MRITKFGHACVRIEHDGTTVVLDPGGFTEAEAVDGADAVLITHEHFDHLSVDNLRATDAPIYTIAAVEAAIRAESPEVAERVTVVAPGDAFDVGLPVRAIGEMHAVIHPEFPQIHNSGYLINAGEESVYHPGDALTLPGQPIDVLLLPSSAPWLKASEAVDFARAVKAPRNLAIHDRIYTEVAHHVLETHMNAFLPKEGLAYIRLADGESL